MKKACFSLLAMVCVIIAHAANIVKIEYFFNQDPGFGYGYSILPTVVDSIISWEQYIPIPSDLPEGINALFIRTKNSDGKWSHTYARQFYLTKNKPSKLNIDRVEYYFNTDPGQGNATEIPLDPKDSVASINYIIPISDALPDGLNILFVRVRNNYGQWSQISKRLFFKQSSNNLAITQWEYSLDAGFGSNNGKTVAFTTPEHENNLNYTIDLSAIKSGGHTLFSRVKNTLGQWSQTSCRFFVLSGNKEINKIKGVKYYLSGTDTTTAVFSKIFETPQAFIDINNLVLHEKDLKLTPLETYKLHIAIFDSLGVTSQFMVNYFTFYDSIPTGKIPINKWVPFKIDNLSLKSDFSVPDSGNWFVFVKKLNNYGYSSTWNGSINLTKSGQEIAKESGTFDFDLQVADCKKGLYNLELTTSINNCDGFIKIASAPDTIKLNEWAKGTVLRPVGSDWKCFDIVKDIDTLFIQSEGFGVVSYIEVFYQNINQNKDRWLFCCGYQIKGNIIKPKKGRYYLRYKDSAVLWDGIVQKADQRREYIIFVGGNIVNGISKLPLAIENLSTYKVGQGKVSIKIKGTGFKNSDEILLKNGKKEYYAETILEDTRNLTAIFNLTDSEAGFFELCIRNTDTTICSLKLVEIVDNCISEIITEIIGRDKLRLGRFQTYIVRYTNKGCTDAHLVPIILSGIPINARIEIVSEIKSSSVFKPVDSNEDGKNDFDLSPIISDGKTATIYVIDPKVSAGSTEELVIRLKIETNSIPPGFIPEDIDYDGLPNSSDLDDDGDGLLDLYESQNGTAPQKFDTDEDGNPDGTDLYPNDTDNDHILNDSDDDDDNDGLLDETERKMGTNPLVQDTDNDGIWDSKDLFPVDTNNDGIPNVVSNELILRAYAGSPIINWGGVNECWDATMLLGLNYMSLADPTGISGCLLGMQGTYSSVTNTESNLILTGVSFLANSINTILNCGAIFIPPLKIPATATSLLLIATEGNKSFIDGCDPKNMVKDFPMSLVNSSTPEDKYGPMGHSTVSNSLDKQEHFIDSTQLFEYRIDYWNKEDATAPAAIVYIRDTLDTDFDISTLNFTEIGFLKWKVKLDGGSYFNVNVDCRPDMPYIVNVEGTVDPVTREVFWVHKTLDPKTMELSDDPLSGYLPPIDSTGYQIGWVDFNIKAKPGLPDGTLFSNQARVNFDGVGKWGPAPPHGPYINTWDKTEPVSRVLDLPAEVVADSVVVKWKGSDSGSGIKTYSVFVSNNNDYKKWINSSTDTMAWFKGEKGTVYTFYSIATDFVGNTETSKKNYEALTRFVSTGHTDLKSGNDSSNFEIFPNPASCCFTLRLNSAPKHTVKVAVFNSTGQQVYWGEFSGQEKEFDLSSLPKGIYTVKILSGSDVGFQKVLLQ